ncbi:DapH/DapD/GlmU-related protein [Candidatus Laterigemmans baculatus]|uniref:DapH/DapD/GlmU-related protein n=1 Tax=Candidatus Laterigemmans baculatus TaxID=2770505 RepID=UPI001F222C42|nr:putative colanic acid biosynthesis acetyltransferase [Candidatus Laterigemmans baculatus]
MLRLFGARVGKNVNIHPSVQIFIPWAIEVGDWSAIGFDVLVYNLGPVRIGERVTISQRAHLCGGSHDHRDPTLPLLKSPITIGDDVWVCADAFIGPGVSLGSGAVVGARSVVVKDVESWTIAAGNPAILIGQRELYVHRD